MQKQDFMDLSRQEVLSLIGSLQRPKLGVFVPDGSRRLVLAYTNAEPGSEEFYQAVAELPAKYLYDAIRTFFDYGLPTLLVPILGRSILKRGQEYQQYTLLRGLELLFSDASWINLYRQYDICVQVYGHPECLQGTVCEPALQWIKNTCEQTAENSTFLLMFGIGESSVVGEESAWNAVNFIQRYGRSPSHDEQIMTYYGRDLPMADFFIMTSKMSGMGALPNLLVNGDTEIYFLPTVMGINEWTYRSILFDILFGRASLRTGIQDFELNPENRLILKSEYERSQNEVIGLGFTVGKVWVMDDNIT